MLANRSSQLLKTGCLDYDSRSYAETIIPPIVRRSASHAVLDAQRCTQVLLILAEGRGSELVRERACVITENASSEIQSSRTSSLPRAAAEASKPRFPGSLRALGPSVDRKSTYRAHSRQKTIGTRRSGLRGGMFATH
ncbi:hypothetical protein BW686_22480 [Pseudomonas syringae]|uniref:Uncharacterized protein n=1 Tax=Pseudomonas syringae TaxID=317 RepID=A0A244EL98_PSESX|nr:hypothetical protein BW686_22480 [Pseudomonas syringae]